jgi:hypothetical protein
VKKAEIYSSSVGANGSAGCSSLRASSSLAELGALSSALEASLELFADERVTLGVTAGAFLVGLDETGPIAADAAAETAAAAPLVAAGAATAGTILARLAAAVTALDWSGDEAAVVAGACRLLAELDFLDDISATERVRMGFGSARWRGAQGIDLGELEN